MIDTEKILLGKRRRILSCYIMLGYPTLEESIATMKLASKYADIIEIGFPFSDPIADGPVIQKAAKIALQNGISPDAIRIALEELKDIQVIKIIMTYANIILTNPEITKLDLDGFIIPDMPVEYTPIKLLGKTIFIVSPNTNKERLKLNIKHSKGFIYLVSQLAITGSEFKGDERNTTIISDIRELNPDKIILSGFGIANSDNVRYILSQGVDGVIIGSALIRAQENNSVEKLLIDIREALNKN